MVLAGLFRRKPPLTDLSGLEDFLDRNAAFLVQKCLFEYARGRAGLLAQDLFKERPFQEALEAARWQAFPIGLRMVAEMIEGALRPSAGRDALPMLRGLTGSALAVLDRYARPGSVSEAEWSAAREALRSRLSGLQLSAPKPAKDVPLQDAEAVFGLMPIHRSLRANDLEMVTNHLRVTLCGIAGSFAAGADFQTLSSALAARGRAPLEV